MYLTDLGTGVAVLNSQVVPISQMVAKTGFPVYMLSWNRAALTTDIFTLAHCITCSICPVYMNVDAKYNSSTA